jgi:beta-lactamase regulating signal transducer with metallopeptidase domain
MMSAIDQFAQDWSHWMFAASWQLALMVTVVAVLARLLRNVSPRLRHALWLLVLVKVFLPPSLTLPTGIGSWGLARIAGLGTPYEQVFGTAPVQQSPVQQSPDQQSPVQQSPDQQSVVDDSPGASFEEPATMATQSIAGMTTTSILMIVWAVGAILLWLLVAVRYRRLAKSIRGTPTIDEGPVRVAMEKSAIALGIPQSPDLHVTDTLTSPFLFGVVQPCVVLPKQFVADATDSELSAVLTHELVHLRRRDTLIGWLQVVAQGLFWFHPFVWWASRELRHEREEACDDSVLRDGGIAPDSYGASMMRVLTSAKARSLADGSFLGVFERGTKLQIRLEQIMSYEPTKRPFGVISKLAIALVAAILLPMATGVSNQLDAQEANTKARPKQEAKTPYPQVVRTVPKIGATKVKTTLKALRITFDRDMSGGMSWTGGPPLFPPTDDSQKARWIDKRTCVLPVKLERAKFYRVGINSKSFRNFKASDGTPTPPTAIYFATEGAPPDVVARAMTPEIVKLVPSNGATDVDPALKAISVTFNMPMGGGMSWTGGGPEFPKIPEGVKPGWSKDKLTCTLPVKLEPGHKYRLGLNSRSHNNFQSAGGIQLAPVVYEFETK